MNSGERRKICMIGGCLFALAFILLIFSPGNVDPVNTQWVVHGGGDNLQHYLGWRFFRESGWNRYLLYMRNLNYPAGTSVIVTDSNPLFCLIFKAFDKILPQTFQFNGIWITLSYLLLGYFAAKISWHLTKSVPLTFTGAMLAVMNPVILQRALIHDTLTAHWLILAAIWLCLNDAKKWNLPCWFLLTEAALLIHFYFIPMLAFILVLQVIRILKGKKRFSAIVMTGGVFFIALVSGYFLFGYSHILPQSGSYGELSLNLNAFINPDSIPAILKARPKLSLQYEGFNYWGLGMLVLVLTGFAAGRLRFVKSILPYLLPAALLVLAAASNDGWFDRQQVYHFDIPERLHSLLSVFRSSGRLVWCLYYLAMFAVLSAFGRIPGKKTLLGVLAAACVMLQFADLDQFFRETAVRFRSPANELEEIPAEFPVLLPEGKTHLFCSEGDPKSADALGLFAADHHMTYNRSANARGIENIFGGDPVDMASADCGMIGNEDVFVYLPGSAFPENAASCPGVTVTELNGWRILYSQ